MQTYRVASVIETAGANYAEVTFLESARFYRILKSNKQFAASIAVLKNAVKNNKQVMVSFTEPNGAIIEKVETVSSPKQE